MNILIIGSGGREHALAWKVAQSPLVKSIWVAPGNPGTAQEPKVSNIAIAATNIQKLIEFAQEHAIDLTLVGPEAPLALGIVDQFSKHHLACFGPTQKAAQLESSKAFSKAFMVRHNIPTATYQTFDNFKAATAYLEDQTFPLVIKEDGLAAGKGVVIAESLSEAKTALEKMFQQANQVVIEAFLTGEEASFIVITDGKHVLPLATSQDHKRLGEGDTGPNTGGMGAYSPAPIVSDALHHTIMETIIWPTIQGMAKEGIVYQGFLYAGLMINAQGEAKVLEYNCRLGDPEAEVILPRLKSDLIPLCKAVTEQTLNSHTIEWNPQATVGVILAMSGYPNSYPKNIPIHGLEKTLKTNQKIFHAGTEVQKNQIMSVGGRVLCVTGMGDSIKEAQEDAYEAADKIEWDGKYCRRDIGYRAIKK